MVAVQGLGTVLLAFDFSAGGQVLQVNTGGGLVHLLTAFPAGADKGLRQVIFANAQGKHLFFKEFLFFRPDWEHKAIGKEKMKGVFVKKRRGRKSQAEKLFFHFTFAVLEVEVPNAQVGIYGHIVNFFLDIQVGGCFVYFLRSPNAYIRGRARTEKP